MAETTAGDVSRHQRLRIAFIMPAIAERPVGGAKTIYQYADHLVQRGHHVVVAHPQESILKDVRARLDHDPDFGPANGAGERASPSHGGETREAVYDPHPWYQSRGDVRNVVVPDLSEKWLGGPYDVVIVN